MQRAKPFLLLLLLVASRGYFHQFFPCIDKNSFIYRTKKENEDSKHALFDNVAEEAPI